MIQKIKCFLGLHDWVRTGRWVDIRPPHYSRYHDGFCHLHIFYSNHKCKHCPKERTVEIDSERYTQPMDFPFWK